jgi:predicted Rossmann fold flavoprotein
LKTIVIGGGASGLLACYYASEYSDVILLEKNDKLGKKLYITGKGRCNVTNCAPTNEFFNNVVSNPKFLYSAIKGFDYSKTMEFFESQGLKLKVERGNRVFPESDKSNDIIKTLQKAIENRNVDIHFSEKVIDFEVDGRFISTVVTDKCKYKCDKVILATGGKSYPLTGSIGDGYNFAEKLGHTIVPLKSALVALNTNLVYGIDGRKFKCKELPKLQGLSLKNVQASIINKDSKKILFSEFGEMLFTETGVSGPIILSLSSRINRLDLHNILLVIDLKPALNVDKLDDRIVRDFALQSNKQFKNSLNGLLPSSLVPFYIAICGIDKEKELNSISKKERCDLVYLLKNLTFTIDSLDSIERAIITAGGINTKEINPKNMKSKLIDNLYFSGEIIDVDALTGGFNLQIAFATGYLAGSNIEKL